MIFDLLWPERTKSKITTEVAGQIGGLPLMILDLLAPQGYKSNITPDKVEASRSGERVECRQFPAMIDSVHSLQLTVGDRRWIGSGTRCSSAS